MCSLMSWGSYVRKIIVRMVEKISSEQVTINAVDVLKATDVKNGTRIVATPIVTVLSCTHTDTIDCGYDANRHYTGFLAVVDHNFHHHPTPHSNPTSYSWAQSPFPVQHPSQPVVHAPSSHTSRTWHNVDQTLHDFFWLVILLVRCLHDRTVRLAQEGALIRSGADGCVRLECATSPVRIEVVTRVRIGVSDGRLSLCTL
jgi:hypothetical protein